MNVTQRSFAVLFSILFISGLAFAETPNSSLQLEAESMLDRLVLSLNPIQKPTGEWVAPLEADPSVDVMPLILAYRLGLSHPDLKKQSVQRFEKWRDPVTMTWSSYPGGPPSPDVTGMILHGFQTLMTHQQFAADPKLQKAWAWYQSTGGDEKLNVLNKMILAFGGMIAPNQVHYLSPKVVALPSWGPLNINSIGFGRTGLIPLSVWRFYLDSLADGKKVSPLDPIRKESAGALYGLPRKAPMAWPQKPGFFQKDGLKLVQKVAGAVQKILPTSAEFWAQESLGWILSHQHEDGTWAGAIQITFFCMFALDQAQKAGVGDFSAEINKAWQGLMNWRVPIPDGVIIQLSTIGPVMDTARTLSGAESLLPLQNRERALSWLIRQQVSRAGDWLVSSPSTEPGGWAFEYYNDLYPDVDDTAMAIEAISRQRSKSLASESKNAINRGIEWILGLQNKDGGFPTWDRNNSKIFAFAASKGISGMPEVSDDSQGDITSRVLKSFAEVRRSSSDYVSQDLQQRMQKSINKACRFLTKHKKKIPSTQTPVWRGEWMVNYLYGTSEMIDSMLKIECLQPHQIKPQIDWILSVQNADGGFGESQLGYLKDDFVAAPSTLTQTQFTLAALMEYETQRRGTDLPSVRPQIDRAISWMIQKIGDNPYPSEPEFTGVFVRKVWYARYWMLPHYEGIRTLRDWLELGE